MLSLEQHSICFFCVQEYAQICHCIAKDISFAQLDSGFTISSDIDNC